MHDLRAEPEILGLSQSQCKSLSTNRMIIGNHYADHAASFVNSIGRSMTTLASVPFAFLSEKWPPSELTRS